DAARVLVDSHGHDQEGDVVAEATVSGLDPRLQRRAYRAPGGPELDQNRFLADVVPEIDGVAVQVREDDRLGDRAEGEPGVLRPQRAGRRRDRLEDDGGYDRAGTRPTALRPREEPPRCRAGARSP